MQVKKSKSKQPCKMERPAASLLLVISVWLLLLPGAVRAQGGGDGNPDLKTPQEALKRWRSLRVGAFIHWTPYVLASGQPAPAGGLRQSVQAV